MQKATSDKLVLVTGGSGYVAGWTIIGLLRHGYTVKTTVRDLKRQSEVEATIARHTDIEGRLSFIQADLLQDKGWPQAVEGCEYVAHVASPMPAGPQTGATMVAAAREGTMRVLRAAKSAGVKRVVMTSSVAAAMPAPSRGGEQKPGDENRWTDLNMKGAVDYVRSKTLAEKDAWDYIREDGAGLELTAILPSVILGAALGSDNSASLEIISRLLKGHIPGIPRVGFSILHMDDLVNLQLRALSAPAAANERFIASSNFLWMEEICRLLRENFGQSAKRVPTTILPDLFLHLAAIFKPALKQITPNIGRRREYSSAKAAALLGWHAQSAEKAVLDCARSLIKEQLV